MFSSIFSVKNMGFHQDIYEVRDGFDTFSWSSRMSRGLPVGHKSLPSIILIQEGSEDFSFLAFYCVKWRIPSDLCAGRYTDWYTGKYKMRSRRRRLGPRGGRQSDEELPGYTLYEDSRVSECDQFQTYFSWTMNICQVNALAGLPVDHFQSVRPVSNVELKNNWGLFSWTFWFEPVFSELEASKVNIHGFRLDSPCKTVLKLQMPGKKCFQKENFLILHS